MSCIAVLLPSFSCSTEQQQHPTPKQYLSDEEEVRDIICEPLRVSGPLPRKLGSRPSVIILTMQLAAGLLYKHLTLSLVLLSSFPH